MTDDTMSMDEVVGELMVAACRTPPRPPTVLEDLVQDLNGIASKHDLGVPPLTVAEFKSGTYLKGWTLEREW